MHNIYHATLLAPNVAFQWLNESSALLYFGPTASALNLLERNLLVQKWCTYIEVQAPPWLLDCVASYETILIEFDCLQIDHYALFTWLKNVRFGKQSTCNSKLHTVPVCYEALNGEYPNDLQAVTASTGLSVTELIDLHSTQPFRVYAVGFMPNFAYLGELAPQLNVPRLKQPRTRVPAGAVAIADNQTAVYPSSSPGGWHIIGYTPLNLMHNKDFVFAVGDKVAFSPINPSSFEDMNAQTHT